MTFTKFWRCAFLVPVMLLPGGCDPSVAPEQDPTPSPVVMTVQVSPVIRTLTAGESLALAVQARDANGAPINGKPVTWKSSDAGTASVSATGVVTALREGSANIRATVDGKSDEATITVSNALAHDLIFDRWSGSTGNIRVPELFRLDIRMMDSEPTRVLPTTTYTGPDATTSPSGGRIAFVAADNGMSFVFTANSDGTAIQRLTAGTAMLEDQPSWSPDGSRIAFRRWTPGGPPGIQNPADIWVIDADGSNLVKITGEANGDGSSQYPTWSPDARKLAYAQETRGVDGYMRARIFTINVDGTAKQPLTADAAQYDDQPSWSPDGQSILFVRTNASLFGDLWLASANGGNERALMANEPPGAQRAPAWSPDGRLIAFISNHEIIGNVAGTYQIYTVTSDGANIIRRTSDAIEKQNPAWIRRP